MTHFNEHQKQVIHSVSAGKRMLQGSAIALLVILFFVVGQQKEPHWPEFWIIRPLIITPAAGAIGGLLLYFLDPLRSQQGWQKLAGTLLSLFGYVVVLWLGVILGLDGTLWN